LARVLYANFSLQTGVRPGVVVLAFGLAITAAGALRAMTSHPANRRLRPAAGESFRDSRESGNPVPDAPAFASDASFRAGDDS